MLWHKAQGAGGLRGFGSLPVIIGATSTVASAGGTLTSVSAEVGDWFFVLNGINGGSVNSAPPALISGYTNIVASNGSSTRPVRLQYRVATSSGTETVTTNDYGLIVVVRNANTVGQAAVIDSNDSSSTVPLPNLAGLSVTNSLILGGPYFPGSLTSNDLVSVTAPYEIKTAAFKGGGNLNAYVAVVNNVNSSVSNASFVSDAFLVSVSWAVELIGQQ